MTSRRRSSRSPRGSGAAAARAAQRPQPRDVGDQAAGAGELLGRHLGEVLFAQQLVGARTELERLLVAAVLVVERPASLSGLASFRDGGGGGTAPRPAGSTGARRNQAAKARSKRSSSSRRATSVCRSVK